MAMKIVRFNCCGMDVHKNLVVATIGITDRKTNVTEYFQRSFSTLNSDLYRLKDWLRSHHCSDVCMESTGKYWIPIFNILEDEINVHLTHPKYVKAIKGKKTDKKDSKWICDLFKHDLIKFSFIPPKEIRELREIARYRYKLVCMRSSERNRYQNCMTVSNVGLASDNDSVLKNACRPVCIGNVRSRAVLRISFGGINENLIRSCLKRSQESIWNLSYPFSCL